MHSGGLTLVPTVGLCLGPYGVARGVGVSYERSTPVPGKPPGGAYAGPAATIFSWSGHRFVSSIPICSAALDRPCEVLGLGVGVWAVLVNGLWFMVYGPASPPREVRLRGPTFVHRFCATTDHSEND